MPGLVTLPEVIKPVMALQPRTTNVAITTTNTNFISVKNVQKAYLLICLQQTDVHADVITLYRATAVGKMAAVPVGAVAITAAMMRYWYNIDCATLETWTEGTAAATVTVDVGQKPMMYLIEFLVDNLGATYDAIGFSYSDSTHATNYISATWLLTQKYAGPVSQSPLVEAD